MKATLQLSAFFMMFYTVVAAQPYAIGHTTITFADPSRNNRAISTEIYYPADVEGENTTVTTTTADKFPVLVFGHGFVMGYDAYEYLWESLVAEGFIMAFPTTEGGILPSHNNFGNDLAFIITAITNLDTNENSLFFNRVSDMNAVMGHSMGGGAAFLAASTNTDIKALVTLAPAETNPSAVSAAGQFDIPALIIAGENDCVTPPSGNQIPMYDNLQSECKTYISIIGGSHCQMADSNFLCGIGEATCSPSPEISRAEQHEIILNYTIDWLKARLKNDCIAGTNFDENIISDSEITFEKTCLQCNPLAVADISQSNDVKVVPNPFTEVVMFNSRGNEAQTVTIYDSNSRQLAQFQLMQSASYNGRDLADGIYFFTVAGANGTISRGKLLKL